MSKRVRRGRLLLLAATLVGGCISLTPGGERVRLERNPNAVKECVALGQMSAIPKYINGTGWSQNEKTLRNETAQLGGDTVLILQERFGGLTARTFGEAYRCGK